MYSLNPVPADFYHSLVLMMVLFITAAWSLARPSIGVAILLALLSVSWVLFNGPLEGRILYSMSSSHGVTESDLLAVVGCLLALAAFARAVRE